MVVEQRNNNSFTCPACANLEIDDEGPLPEIQPHVFGGTHLDIVLKAGRLFHCNNCNLYFRYPYLSQATLIELYRHLPESTWESKKPGLHWPLIFKLIERYSPNKIILDVGCFRGDFLRWLPNDWRKLGIEPNITARKATLTSNIELVGDTVEQTHSISEQVGVITALDVLEHVVNPLDFLRQLKKMLTAKGSLIIFTGTADTLAFRIFGCDYWYCSCPEHLSFLSLRWFRWAAKQIGLSLVWYRYLASEEGGLKAYLLNFLRLSLFVLVKRLKRLGAPKATLAALPVIRRVTKWQFTPLWHQAKDHIMVVLKKQ